MSVDTTVMKVLLKKTNELSDNEKEQICVLFSKVFGIEKTIEKFNSQFSTTCLKYSLHGLMVNDEQIVGCYSAIPYRFRVGAIEHIFALSVDTMIEREFRGNPFNLKRMAKVVYDSLVRLGINFVYGLPNDNVYLVRKKVLKWRDIGRLDFYILPIRPRNLISFGFILEVPLFLYNFGVNLFLTKIPQSDGAANRYLIEQVKGSDFLSNRFGSECYKRNNIGDISYYYTVSTHNSAKICYLLDVIPLSKDAIEITVKDLYGKIKNEADAILYVGHLNQTPRNLLRIPTKFQPKKLRIAGKLLDGAEFGDGMFELENWNVNLSNFDVL